MNTGVRLGALAALLAISSTASAQDNDGSASENTVPSPDNLLHPELQPNYTHISTKIIAPSNPVVIGPSGDVESLEHYERRRLRVSERRDDVVRDESHRGEKEIVRGERKESRGVRLIEDGDKIGGERGAKLGAQGRRLEDHGAREVSRGARAARGDRSSSGGGTRASRRAERHAARIGSGGTSWAASSSRSHAKTHDAWHHD